MSGSTIPAPISWTPSPYWDGNDGSWNSFVVEIGTPPQGFRIFPSTAGQEVWIPVPDGCTAASPSDPGYCGNLRGAIPVNGVNSSGFATNASSTWQNIGIFTLDAQESQLGYGGNGLYGFDTVGWGNSTSLNLTKSIVAGIADPDFWLGLAGIGPKPINFTGYNDPIPSFMGRLVNESKIPSLSWAYTAGAMYRDKAPASLTLGGYDQNRFDTGLSLRMNADNSRPLQVAVQRILTQNTLIGTSNLLPSPTYHFVDSTIPHIWLPDDAVSQFVDAFGLSYDNKTDLYLVNETIHTRLLQLNPTITFVLANSTAADASSTVNINLPYAAFDLNVSYPFYPNATRYFPIRRAANDTQYTIGRTLFQEAYVIADHERNNFTIAQTVFPTDIASQHLVAIQKPSATASSLPTQSASSPNTLTAGDIAGIVVGAVGALAIVALAAWFCIRRKSKKRHEKHEETVGHAGPRKVEKPYLDTVKPVGAELHDEGAYYEVEGEYDPHQEADGAAMRSELSGHHPTWSRYGVQELYSSLVGNPHEAPGDEAPRYEMSGSERGQSVGQS